MVRPLLAACAAIVVAVPASAAAATPPIKHVFVMVLENHEFSDTFGLTGQLLAPYFNRTLVPDGQLLGQYYGVGHASADNYIAMISGQPPTPSAQDDCSDYNGTNDPKPVGPEAVPPYNLAQGDGCLYPANFLTIGDQLTAKGLTWKSYNQDIPSPCYLGSSYMPAGRDKGDYRRKHNPFVLFESIRQSPQCERNVVGLPSPAELRTILSSEQTAPNFSYIVPNQCGDGHDACTNPAPPLPLGADPLTADEIALTQIDSFLQTYVPPIIESPVFKKDGLLVITFDEAVENLSCCNEQPGPATDDPGNQAGIPGSGGGNSGAVVISPFIKPGASDPAHMLNLTGYNHYSLLRSIEDIFGLPYLGYAGVDGLASFGPDVYTAAP